MTSRRIETPCNRCYCPISIQFSQAQQKHSLSCNWGLLVCLTWSRFPISSIKICYFSTLSICILQEIDVPEDLPFEIVDNPGDQAVFLKREFAGENIQVTVSMNFDKRNDLEEIDEDDDDDERNENSMEPTLYLVVTIDKGEGSLLEFCCNLNSDDLEIEGMVMKKRDDVDGQSAYQGPKFSDLDENLQKALHRYLEARGIKNSLFDVLHKYMSNKDERESLRWLKNMKGLIA
ncbi:hypothetical protein B296_00010992 [Ensete ventricosum]|uniref:Mitochondrial glycoprotein n=1 Tax=Ensete ventricosum TaxID=4639 RepID=A0A427B8C2_ENSVE|nr:hypothetical protein B296_00010992 [Ensete ventricosum]